jgi:hypothetical protein
MDSLDDLGMPSTVVNSLEDIQTATKSLIYGRPVENQGLQPALYSPTIAQLVHDFENLDAIYPDPSSDYLAKSLKLLEISNGFYTGQNTGMRFDDLRHYHGIFFGDINENVGVEKAFDGTRVNVSFSINDWVYAVLELKDEFGIGGDPHLYAMMSFAKAIQNKKVSTTRFYRANISPHLEYPGFAQKDKSPGYSHRSRRQCAHYRCSHLH